MQSLFIPTLKKCNHCSILVFSAIIFLLSACGGGGGSSPTPTVISSAVSSSLSSSSSSSSKAPAPTLTVANTEQKIKVGETGSISITTTNTNSCTEPTLGSIPVNGSVNVKPTKGGRVVYTINCTGDGGEISKEALVVTPFPVQKSSYLNKNNIDVQYSMKEITSFAKSKNIFRSNESVTSGYMYGDFMQDGTYSIIVSTNVLDPIDVMSVSGYVPPLGKMYIFKKTSSGWADVSDQLITGDRSGCFSPRKVIVADFNNDGKADAYVACHGHDWSGFANTLYHFESSHIIFSQPDGTYLNKKVQGTETTYGHGASAADIDGDGNIDIVLVDIHYENSRRPIRFLMGRGDGNFTTDTTRIPLTVNLLDNSPLQYFSIELIHVNNSNQPSLFVAGVDGCYTPYAGAICYNSPSYIYENTNGYYNKSIVIPEIGEPSGLYDFIVSNSFLYVLRDSFKNDTANPRTKIQKINLGTMDSSVIYTAQNFFTDKNGSWYGNALNWVTIRNEKLVELDSEFTFSLLLE